MADLTRMSFGTPMFSLSLDAGYKVSFVVCGPSSIHPEGKLIKCRCINL